MSLDIAAEVAFLHWNTQFKKVFQFLTLNKIKIKKHNREMTSAVDHVSVPKLNQNTVYWEKINIMDLMVLGALPIF